MEERARVRRNLAEHAAFGDGGRVLQGPLEELKRRQRGGRRRAGSRRWLPTDGREAQIIGPGTPFTAAMHALRFQFNGIRGEASRRPARQRAARPRRQGLAAQTRARPQRLCLHSDGVANRTLMMAIPSQRW